MTEKEITARIAKLRVNPTALADNELLCLRMRQTIHNCFLAEKNFFAEEEHYDMKEKEYIKYSLADYFAQKIIGGMNTVKRIFDEEMSDIKTRAKIIEIPRETYTDKQIKWSDEEV